MSYHEAMRRLAWDEGASDRSFYYEDDGGVGGGCPDCESPDCTGDCEDAGDDVDLDDEGRLRQRITDAMPEGDPEAYMASGQELLDELLAKPDRTKLKLILDKEVEELRALLGDISDIDLEGMKNTALAAFDAAAEKAGPSRGAVMAAIAAIKAAAGRALGLGRGSAR